MLSAAIPNTLELDPILDVTIPDIFISDQMLSASKSIAAIEDMSRSAIAMSKIEMETISNMEMISNMAMISDMAMSNISTISDMITQDIFRPDSPILNESMSDMVLSNLSTMSDMVMPNIEAISDIYNVTHNIAIPNIIIPSESIFDSLMFSPNTLDQLEYQIEYFLKVMSSQDSKKKSGEVQQLQDEKQNDFVDIQIPKHESVIIVNKELEEFERIQNSKRISFEKEMSIKFSKFRNENINSDAQKEVMVQTAFNSIVEELENIRDIFNKEMIKVNKMMKENQKSNERYWPRTIAVSFGTSLLGFILGLFGQEIKDLLMSVPGLLQSFIRAILR